MSDAFEQLRIIAADGGRLSDADRKLIGHAADAIEHMARDLVSTQAKLIEEQAKRIALNDRLLDMKRAEATAEEKKRRSMPFMSMGTGWQVSGINRGIS